MKTHHIQKMHHKARPTLSLKRAVDSKAEKEAKHHNDGEKLCILACGDAFFWCNSISAIGKQGIHEPPGTLDLIGVTPQCQLCHISMCTGPHNEHPRETNVQSRVVQTKLSVLKVQTTNWSRNCSRN